MYTYIHTLYIVTARSHFVMTRRGFLVFTYCIIIPRSFYVYLNEREKHFPRLTWSTLTLSLFSFLFLYLRFDVFLTRVDHRVNTWPPTATALLYIRRIARILYISHYGSCCNNILITYYYYMHNTHLYYNSYIG